MNNAPKSEEFFQALIEGRVTLRKQHRGDVWQISVTPPRQYEDSPDPNQQEIPPPAL